MDFSLADNEKRWQTKVRKLVDEEIGPRAAELDRTGEYRWDTVKSMAKMGLYGLPFPQEYGGCHESHVAMCVVLEEIARGCASTSLVLAAAWLIGDQMNFGGTDEQKRKFLAPIARGEQPACHGLTEPEAGSDVGGIKTTAVPRGDGYEISGVKWLCGGAGVTENYIITAKTDPQKGIRGISCFFVNKAAPGFEVTAIHKKMGFRGQPHGILTLRHCLVPKENLLGKLNEGFKVFAHGINLGRLVAGAQAVGLAQAAFDEALKYSKVRTTWNQIIAKHQAIQFMLADMAIKVETARLLTCKTADLMDKGGKGIRECAMAKLYASEVAMSVTDDALQVHGGAGYIEPTPVERYFRDARAWKIMEGTSEIMRMVIGRELIKE